MNEVKKDTWVRLVVMILSIINHILVVMGKSPIPIDDQQVQQFVALGIDICVTLWVWWKNNSFTKCAIEGDKYKDKLKEMSKGE